MMSNNPTTFRVQKPLRGSIWHITDLHFDPYNPPGCPDAKIKDLSSHSFSTDYYKQLFSFASKVESKATALIVTGDLVQAPAIELDDKRNMVPDDDAKKAREAGFRLATKFIDELANNLGLSKKLKSHVVVCPGNHDVSWRTKKHNNLSLFENATAKYLTPASGKPWYVDKDAGFALLVLDTAFLGGSVVDLGGKDIRIDAPGYDLKKIDRIIKEMAGKKSVKAVPPGVLGIVAAHHPPGAIATTSTEVKLVELAIAGAQARRALVEAGFRVFFHGHKHLSVAEDTKTNQANSDLLESLTIGGPSLTQTSPGLQIIDYLVSREYGEAVISIRQYAIRDGKPSLTGDVWTKHISPIEAPPAHTIKLLERISDFGDSRTDFCYFGIPGPRSEIRGSRSWKKKNNLWSLKIARDIDIPNQQTKRPCVAALDENSTASLNGRRENAKKPGAWTWNISLECKGDNEITGFVERSRTTNGYALSKHSRTRIRNQEFHIPDITDDEEYLIHLVHYPAEHLEFFFRFPTAITHNLQVDVRTYVPENSLDGRKLVLSPEIRQFTNVEIDKMPRIKRMRVLIRRPLTGVAYAVIWTLPDKTEAEAKMAKPGDSDYLKALARADKLRKSLLKKSQAKSNRNVHKTVSKVFRDTLEKSVFINENARCPADLEWGFFVPDHSWIPNNADAKKQLCAAKNNLLPVMGNYKDSYLWAKSWVAGMGLAGRAYATGIPCEYVGEKNSRHLPRISDPWLDEIIEIYEPYKKKHSELYALPIQFYMNNKPTDIILGVLCLGAYSASCNLNLMAGLPNGELAHEVVQRVFGEIIEKNMGAFGVA